MVSDHLSWSSLAGERIPDLLPIPMTHATLIHFGSEVSRVQDRLQRTILIENPSRTLAFRDDCFAEPDFLRELCAATGCGILLDVNNILVSATNLGLTPEDYVDAIDPRLVGEIHVAGHSLESDEDGAMTAIDDHGSPVSEACWTLLDRFVTRAGPKPVLVERDTDIPPFAELAAEAAIADRILAQGWAHAA